VVTYTLTPTERRQLMIKISFDGQNILILQTSSHLWTILYE